MKFSHNYDKLKFGVFPTIRSVNYMKRKNLKVGSIDTIQTPTTTFKAKLLGVSKREIQDIPLAFLQYDASPIPIWSRLDFVNLINSFIPYNSNRLSTKKAILWWERYEETKTKSEDAHRD